MSDRDEPGNPDVYVMNADGTSVTRLTTAPQVDVDPVWSPDGSKIAYRCSDQLCIMNAGGSGRAPIPNTSGAVTPAWSPDGGRMAFSKYSEGVTHVFVISVDGSGVERLTENPGGSEPAWSPDGSKIAYVCSLSDLPIPAGANICVMNSDGSGQRVLFETPGAEDAPDWSPDGSRLVIWQGSSLLLVSADGVAAPFAPGAFSGFNQRPSWSPNGTEIVFDNCLPPEGQGDICVVKPDGTGLQRLTTGPANDSDPSWQPIIPATPTPTATPFPPTMSTLTQETTAGSSSLEVADGSGFLVRDAVVINPGGATEERSVVAALGSLDLAAPLLFAHEPGEEVRKFAQAVKPGDADCSGGVDAVDALRVLRRVASLTPYADCWAAGNVGCLDDINAVDALRILRFVAGLPPTLSSDCPPIGVLPEP